MKDLLQKIRDLVDESGYNLEDVLAKIRNEEDDIDKIIAYSVAYQYILQKDKDPRVKLLRERYNILLDNLKQSYLPPYQVNPPTIK